MKILQVNSVYKYGSTGNIVSNIHKLLLSQGDQSFIAYGRDGDISNEELTYKIGNNIDVYLHGIGSRLFDKHGLYSTKATKIFIQYIEDLQPDIIHFHNIHGYYINYEILFEYLNKRNKPVVWTLHDCWSYTGHCAYYDFVSCQKWQDKCCQCPQLNQYPKSFFFDNSTKNFLLKKELFTSLSQLTLVTPSQWLKDEVQKSFFSSTPVEVINNGIDLDVFYERESNFRKKYMLENKFLILGVASVWEDRKGFKYFLELAKKIADDEYIILVGLNDKQLQNLPKNILGIKRTQNLDELAEIYTSVDVFVNPTLEDNFPTTNLESLACGIPVITFDSGGSSESIDENCGIVVQKASVEDMYEAILEVKNNTKLFYKDTAKEKAKCYNKNECFNDYISFYKMILKKYESNV